jgi:hypothetical protein
VSDLASSADASHMIDTMPVLVFMILSPQNHVKGIALGNEILTFIWTWHYHGPCNSQLRGGSSERVYHISSR